MSFGNQLNQAREALGLSLAEVAQRTKIRSDYLGALENEQLATLPERTFTRAYVQRFAREVGLDPAPLLADFDRLSAAPPQSGPVRAGAARAAPGRPLPYSASRGRSVGPSLVLGALLLLGVGGYFGYSAYSAQRGVQATTQDPGGAALPSTRQVMFSLKTVPSGAQIYLDNRNLGRSPVANFPLDARPQAELRVESSGRQTYVSTIDLSADRDLSVTLQPAGATSPGSPAAPVEPAAPVDPAVPVDPVAPVGAPARSGGPAQTSGQAQPTASGGKRVVVEIPGATVQSPAAQPVAIADPAVQVTPAPDTTAPAATAPTTAAQVPPTPPAPATPTAAPVRLTFTGESWTRVTAGGRVLYEGTPAAGTSRDFPAGVVVRSGSAGAVRVSLAGAPPTALGPAGQVVTRRF